MGNEKNQQQKQEPEQAEGHVPEKDRLAIIAASVKLCLELLMTQCQMASIPRHNEFRIKEAITALES